jgi:glycosyltransferase involved in cell wall biosynthesis
MMVHLDHNRGLGPALDSGLAASRHDVIARMDADDVSMPHRFEVEIPLIAEADIVGAGLLEFVGDIDHIVGQRVPPTDREQIHRYARMHDPFNHPTVVYRRTAVLAAGGYGDLPLMEDYALFARMLQNGARAVNVAEPLVYYRVGETSFKRRGGADLLRSELRLQREFRRQGFTSSPEYVRNVVVRGGYRMIPWRFRRAVYRPIVAHYTEHGEHGGHQAGGEAPGGEPGPSAPSRPEPSGNHEPGSTTKPYEPGSQTKPLPVRW